MFLWQKNKTAPITNPEPVNAANTQPIQPTIPPKTLSTAKAIPLRDSKYRPAPFAISFEGKGPDGNTGAIKELNGISYDVWYDTGSVALVIPYAALDRSKISVIQTKTSYHTFGLCDLVKGNLFLKSQDGTYYTLEDFVLYARYTPDGQDAPEDRGIPNNWGGGIAGGIPKCIGNPKDPNSIKSVSYALTEKYSPDHMGVGIISEPGADIKVGYKTLKSYLSFIPAELSNINSDIAWLTKPSTMNMWTFIDTVPGFSVQFKFAPTADVPNPPSSLIAEDLVCTIDTGAPDLEVQISKDDPQLSDPYKPYFKGPLQGWMGKDTQTFGSCTLGMGTQVDITCKCDTKSVSYRFDVDTQTRLADGSSPAIVYIGKYNSGAPFANLPKRFNLGNTVYFFWHGVLFDLKNERFGIYIAEPKK